MAGTAFGRYSIIRELGRGAMAAVYLAEDSSLMRQVAIKSLLPQYASDAAFRERFLREGRILARVRHESIVPIYDFGEAGGVPYLVMEYLPGGTLAERLRDGDLSLDERIVILRRVALALDAAHAAGVIHRDLKPANILFDAEGRAFVGDFGVGRLDGASTGVTMPGTVIGTANYMSPEQVNGAPPTAAADIYSYGVLAYEVLTGVPPFTGDSVWEIMRQHVEERPRPPGALNAAIAFADGPILWALSKDPGERPPRAMDVAEALEAGYRARAGGTPVALPNGQRTKAVGRSRRVVLFASGGAALVAAAVAVGVALVLDRGDGASPVATPTSPETVLAGETTAPSPPGSETAAATPTGTPPATIVVPGEPILFESFDDPADVRVPQPSGLSGRGFAAEGAYGIDDVSASDNLYVAVTLSAGGKDHAIGVDAFSPEGGSIILTCRSDERFDVRFVVRPSTQEFRVEVLDKRESRFTKLTPRGRADAIRPGEGNRYQMVCVGDTVQAGINGVVVAEHLLPGLEGEQVSFGADGGVRSVFDNLEIRRR